MLASFFDARRSKRLASLSIMSVVFSSSFTTLPGIALAAGTDICTPQDIAQVAYWKLDEAAASDPVTDTGAGAHTGTALGAGGGNNLPQPVTGVPALPFLNDFGKNFDGTDDGIDLGSNVGNFGYGDSFTISAWINPALDSANRVIYGNAWQNAGYELRVTSTNTLRFILIHDGSNYNGMDTNVLSAGWHHVVGTWDGTNLKVYVDGTEDSAASITGGAVTTISTSANTFIGQTPEVGSEQFFKGDIDDVRVFSDDLTGAQVTRLAAGRCGADKLSPTNTLASDNHPSVIGDNVNITATLTGYAPTGTVEFFDGATSLGTVSVSNSEAIFSTDTLAVGSHSITAMYSGDDDNNTAVSSVFTQEVTQSPTSSVNLSAPNPSIVGQNVTFTATVTGVGPTGDVDFFSGSILLGNSPVFGATSTGAYATFTTDDLAVGTSSITAIYNGDGNNLASTSNTVNLHVVDPSPTSTVNLSVPNPSIVGTAMTLNATVTGYLPTGTVSFFSGSLALGTSSVFGATATGAYATLTTAPADLAVGTSSITAIYNGDGNNLASTSNTVNLHVVEKSPTVTLTYTSQNPTIVDAPVTFTATVEGYYSTGDVEFYDGATLIATSALGSLTATGGTAVTTTSALSVGPHDITAVYLGDGQNLTSTSTPILVQVVDQSPTTTVLVSFESPVFAGDAVNFFVQVTGFLPSGDITITSNDKVIGIGTLDPSGFVEITVVTNTVGTFTVQAHYAGDVNNLPSESEESLLEILGGSSGRFQSLVRYLTGNMATGFGSMNTPAGAFGGPGPGNGTGELTDEQVQTLCAVRDQILALNATAVLDYMTEVYAHIFDVSDNAILAVIRDGEGCGVEAAVVEQEEEQSTAEGAVAKVDRHAPVALPVDENGIPVSSNEVWNACIRNYQLFNGNDTRPLNCRKYHEGHTWEHPDLGLTFTWTDRLVQQIRMRKNFVTVVVPTPGYVVNRSMETDTVQMPFTVSLRTGNAQ